MIEVWVDIEGIPFYQVSNKGNFRSITREITVTSTRQRPYKKIINGTSVKPFGNDSNLLIVFYVQIMPDDFVMQLHRF